VEVLYWASVQASSCEEQIHVFVQDWDKDYIYKMKMPISQILKLKWDFHSV